MVGEQEGGGLLSGSTLSVEFPSQEGLLSAVSALLYEAGKGGAM